MIVCRLSFTAFISLLFSINTFSQEYTQTIRGTVRDKIIQTPLHGATVVVMDSNPVNGAITDENGNFRLTGVSVGKSALKISFIGYKDVVLTNLVINSGKEAVLAIHLEEAMVLGKEVVVTAKIEKNEPLNDMVLVSGRAFSVEETRKFAGAFNDLSRMALSYSGVVQSGDIKNDLSIRGNSPNGLLWRMEGVDIPNPNHYSYVGTAGGAISILGSQLLSNSDFISGAFPAEYGNVLSGVFDLKLRKGNNEKREYTLQTGFIGIDLAAEGPFKKGYAGSYLVNYRYSTLALLAKIGLPLSAASVFQDLSFNIWLPANKLGDFSIFGFGGLSHDVFNAQKDSAKWITSFDHLNRVLFSNTGALGITHTKILNSKSYIRTSLAASGAENGNREEALDTKYASTFKYNEYYVQDKVTLSSTLNHKFNTKINLRSGLILDRLGYSFSKKALNISGGTIEQLLKTKDNTYTLQVFTQLRYYLTEKLTLNTGINYLHFLLNNSNSLTPRASVKYELTATQSLSFGYGLHSQIQPLGVYLTETTLANGTKETFNKNLDLSKSHHVVLAYNRLLNERLRIIAETYYQSLYNIPVSPNPNSTLSTLNSQNGYITEKLVNNGTGRNYGLELTLEQFMYRNFYFLMSASLFDSKYRATDGVWRNTYYNANYNFTLTLGKEFTLSEKRKKRIIGVHIKTLYTGGFRRTPIDILQSRQVKETVFIDADAFSQRNPDYFRVDTRISVKRNFTKLTSTLSLDIQNVSNYQNVRMYFFDAVSGTVKPEYQLPLTPVLSYRLEF